MDVLVVGAGPVGLTMACELVRHGVKVRVVDRLAVPSDKSKALVLWPRSCELLDKAGMLEPFREAAGTIMHGMSVYNEQKQRLVHISMDELRSPYNWILGIPQNDTERVLEERLGQMGVKVERGVEMAELKSDDQKVTVTLRKADGSTEQVEAPYVAACDGAHSACRHCLDIKLEGETVPEEFAMGDVDVECSLVRSDEVTAFFHPTGVCAFFPIRGPRYRVFAIREGVGSDPQPVPPTLDELQQALHQRGLTDCRLSNPHWLAAFRINERCATGYRHGHGRVFLAGDAAHCHSPIGGQGMNTGMQDAFNLAWKLALVVQGKAAPEPLLDSYSVERHQIGAAVVGSTATARKAITLRHPVAQEVRNKLMPLVTGLGVVQQRIRETATELAIKYKNSPLSKEIHAGLGSWLLGGGIHPGERAPDGDLLTADGKPTTIFELTRGTGFHLLLLAGKKESGLDALAAAGRWARQVHPDLIQVHWIDSKPRPAVWDQASYTDPEDAVHKLYGASDSSLYLVRPDGYVGLRCQPPSREHLEQYLDNLGLKAGATA